jgi:hypothetical protein
MTVILTVVGLALVFGFVLRDTLKQAEQQVPQMPVNDGLRWTKEEIFICAYVAIFVEDDTRLNDSFQTFLSESLERSERAVYEKIRRLMTVGQVKSDASQLDEEVVRQITEMDDVDALEEVEVSLQTLGWSRRRISELTSYL